MVLVLNVSYYTKVKKLKAAVKPSIRGTAPELISTEKLNAYTVSLGFWEHQNKTKRENNYSIYHRIQSCRAKFGRILVPVSKLELGEFVAPIFAFMSLPNDKELCFTGFANSCHDDLTASPL